MRPSPPAFRRAAMNDRPAGIGLRQPHYREVFERLPQVGFLEVHSENFFLDGGASMHALERARAAYPISLHGVGLSLGSAGSADDSLLERHLAKLARLVDRIAPERVSEHLCWGAVDGLHLNDLLPVPYHAAALDLLAVRIDRVQCSLQRPILIENVSTYFEYRDSEMTETAFLAQLARRTGCGILLDLNNLYVNAVNFGFDPVSRLAELPRAAVGEIHLAGHTVTDTCLIDTHGARVCEAVWALYRAACERFGQCATLIEWDTDLPPLDVLLEEAARATAIAQHAEMPLG